MKKLEKAASKTAQLENTVNEKQSDESGQEEEEEEEEQSGKRPYETPSEILHDLPPGKASRITQIGSVRALREREMPQVQQLHSVSSDNESSSSSQ